MADPRDMSYWEWRSRREAADVDIHQIIAEGLADTDDIYQPAYRAYANFITSRLSPLSDVEVARLTDDEIVRLIDGFPKAEIRRVVKDQLMLFCASIGEGINRAFAPIFKVLFWGLFGYTLIGFGCYVFKKYNKESQSSKHDAFVNNNATQSYNKEFQSSKHDATVTTNATQLWWCKRLTSSKRDVSVTSNTAQERPKPSMNPIVLSKYSGTPALKGLKGIAETYIQENIRHASKAKSSMGEYDRSPTMGELEGGLSLAWESMIGLPPWEN